MPQFYVAFLKTEEKMLEAGIVTKFEAITVTPVIKFADVPASESFPIVAVRAPAGVRFLLSSHTHVVNELGTIADTVSAEHLQQMLRFFESWAASSPATRELKLVR